MQLVDRRARRVEYLRLSLIDRCNYRCTYCMPERSLQYGPRRDVLSLEEVVHLCEAFARWGVKRVRLTGGEPTLRRGLLELVSSLSRLPTDRGDRLKVVMTTNGEHLAELARPLREAGLAGLTVSLDSLDADRFVQITRRGHLDRVLAGIEAALDAGFVGIKTNTVAVAGFNDDELGDIARWAWERGVVPRFIELMPMAAGELFVPGQLMDAKTVRERIEQALHVQLQPDPGEAVAGLGPASYFRVGRSREPRYLGCTIGTIGAMTENFCDTCNRLRVSATGQLHGCLARDDTGDLRAALRSNRPGAIEQVVASVLGSKRDGHAFSIDGTGGPNKAMITIGG